MWTPGSLAARLTASFFAVALSSVALFGGTLWLAQRSQVGPVPAHEKDVTTQAVVSALDDAFGAAGGWGTADFRPASALADAAGAALVVEAPSGAALFRTGEQSKLGVRGVGDITSHLVVGGREVGIAVMAYPSRTTMNSQQFGRALTLAAWVSALLSAGVALLLSVLALRGVVAPLRRLAATARAFGEGAGGLSTGGPGGARDPEEPRELGELGDAFSTMAAAIHHHERQRDAMVAGVAHELRTPLSVLQAEVEGLLDGVLEPSPQALVSLRDEVLRLGQMVEDLQAVSSAEAGGLRLDRQMVDLASVVDQAAGSLAGRFSNAGIYLRCHLSAAPVWADPRRIFQVATNLLSNAAKFTPRGGRVEVVVRAAPPWSVLEVSDTGPGVPLEERARIFDRFVQGAAGQRVGGAGIGLALVKDLVEVHEGTVTVEGPPGGGACFVVRLPWAGDGLRCM